MEVQHRGWYAQTFTQYYGALKGLSAKTYDFGLFFLQAGRKLSSHVRVGLVYGRLGIVRLSRNEGDGSTFQVSRYGLGTSVALPYRFQVELAGGLGRGDGPRTFLQVSLHRQLF